MPERMYLDRRPNSPRIHVELTENDIADILDDWPAPGSDAFDATVRLHRILTEAKQALGKARRAGE